MISGASTATAAGTSLPVAPSLHDLHRLLEAFAAQKGAGLSEAELVDHLTAMEQLKSGIAAAQARVTVALGRRRAQREAQAGVPPDQRCRGLAAEVALARQDSPVRGARHIGLAKALLEEMPHTMAALTRGDISEWRATLIVRETAVLSSAHRAQVDSELEGRLAGVGDRKVSALARAIGYRLDPGSAIRRVRGAETDRRVGLRPAPDAMSNLTAFLPVAQGVACFAALTKEADTRRAAGDRRSRGQIMADTLVERITGQTHAGAVPVEVNLVMTDATLVRGHHHPAHLDGYGLIPAYVARQITRDADKAWVRRLFTSPDDGSLVAMDSRRRCFDGQLRQLVVLRDQICRSPWCDAPIRHADHVVRAAEGGLTTADNGQGLCEACNYAKEAPDWITRRRPGPSHVVETVTPTGHIHVSHPPDPPGTSRYPVRLEIFRPRAA